jgi:hypothetical protein
MYRLLCLSRNMTFDRCWDTLLCLEGALIDRTNAFSENHPLGQFVESLPGMSVRPLNSDWRKRLSQLAKEIRRVKFEVPAPFESLKFWPLGIPGAKSWPFPHRMDRLLVVTPFLGDGLMNDFAKRCSSIQVVSRDESLAKLQPETFGHFEKAWILDETANPEPGEMESEQTSPPTQDVTCESAGGEASRDGQALPLIGLHAKVYVIDRGWDASVLIGSANATRSAFGKNVEFLVEIQGKRSLCGEEALLGKPSSGNQKRGSSLADLLVEYDPADRKPEPDSEAEKFEWFVDEIAKSLAAAAPAAECESIEETGSFSIRISATRAVDALDLQGCSLTIRPISLPASQFIPMELSQSYWVEFPRISLLGLTSFFAIGVESADGRLRRQFVLNIPLTNAPEQRHEAILRELLSDRERVLKFLLLMLADSGARDLSSFTDSMAGRDGTGTWTQSLLGGTLFESLVRTLDRDPQRLDQVEDIIRDLRKSSEGHALLPADLESIWEPIRVVRQQQKEQQLKRANRKRG